MVGIGPVGWWGMPAKVASTVATLIFMSSVLYNVWLYHVVSQDWMLVGAKIRGSHPSD